MIIDVVRALAVIALMVLTLGFSSFCLLFHVLADWRASEMGRNVMTFMLTCTVILWYSLINSVFDFPQGVTVVAAFILFSVLAGAVWMKVWLLIKIQKEARSHAHEFWSRDGS